MAIPSITSYDMPTAAELPDNVPSWRPHPRRAVLLIHDMQRFFLSFFPAGTQPLEDLIANIRRIRMTAAALDIPVVYTAQPAGMSRAERGLLYEIWGPGMGREPEAARITAELTPARDDVVIEKTRYSAFFRTGLADFMYDNCRDQLMVCGIYAHIGCLVSACDAYMRDVEPFLVADAVADFSLAEHRLALRYAAQRCAVTLTTGQLVDSLARSARGRWPVTA